MLGNEGIKPVSREEQLTNLGEALQRHQDEVETARSIILNHGVYGHREPITAVEHAVAYFAADRRYKFTSAETAHFNGDFELEKKIKSQLEKEKDIWQAMENGDFKPLLNYLIDHFLQIGEEGDLEFADGLFLLVVGLPDKGDPIDLRDISATAGE